MNTNIDSLPYEIFLQLIEDLSYSDLEALSAVSKLNHDRIETEFKRKLARKYFDFQQFYQPNDKSYLYYYYTIEENSDRDVDMIEYAFNTQNLPIIKFFINKYVTELEEIYKTKSSIYDGDMSIPAIVYNNLAIQILRSPKITIEILEYLKSLYPGIFQEVEVPTMNNWEITGVEKYNPREQTVKEMYWEDNAATWLLPGNEIYEWLEINSEWFKDDWLESSPLYPANRISFE